MALLTICIPIYNRISFLNRIFKAFQESLSFFSSEVSIYVSDNCSTDDICGLCKTYINKGLPIVYHRNDENLGMDGNFANCLKASTGKYTLLLGSDDVPKLNYISSILKILKRKDIGLLHLKECTTDNGKIVYYNSVDNFLLDININITYLSTNIVNTSLIQGIDYNEYRGSFFTQVPAYLKAINAHLPNAVLYGDFYEDDDDSKNNGGYNYFEVFVTNLLSIFKGQVKCRYITEDTYDNFKKIIFKKQISEYVVQLLIFKKKRKFRTDHALQILFKNYGANFYSYYYVLRYLVLRLYNHFL